MWILSHDLDIQTASVIVDRVLVAVRDWNCDLSWRAWLVVWVVEVLDILALQRLFRSLSLLWVEAEQISHQIERVVACLWTNLAQWSWISWWK